MEVVVIGGIEYPVIDPDTSVPVTNSITTTRITANTNVSGGASIPASPAAAPPATPGLNVIALNQVEKPVTTTAEATSPARFDARDDGTLPQTGWVTPGEGLLINDPRGALTTIQTSDLVPSCMTLQSFDTDHAGTLNATDPGWANLYLWVDASGTGVFNKISVITLAQLGITSIDLHPEIVNAANNGNTVYSTDTFTGSAHGASAQLGLSYQPFAAPVHPPGS